MSAFIIGGRRQECSIQYSTYDEKFANFCRPQKKKPLKKTGLLVIFFLSLL